ncbi:TPA: sulfurtransferase [Clostridioides difficile]|uniref:3-mercaptopyruvate sulfurtransferase n=1 Tax=Clostridioides difficile TaxID=1496 RepID=A0A069ATC7_CLODI|nr:sulfurtransferase [Clostridioides difficile]AXU78998.1 3-mercaptopyruvate sulfurtransferase [Clostridioides difficile]EGT3760119.1 sulfurtransferase [Clostridioides difficile]EGT3768765.1 sulfurtransferase [Clostridioides difficile]EGT4112901.1 sulfurtransferase [Clostridioides difficile]EGT4247195.1 sulfurtransferase [Clostridioides difficile]
MKNIISAKELISKLEKNDNLVVIDCRFDLINRTYGIDSYKKGHIKGSFILDIDKDLSSPTKEHGGKNPLQDPLILKEKLEKMGVDNDTTIVTYDDGDLNGACRLFFQLKHLGLKNVYVLDGGITSFVKEGGELEEKVNIPSCTSKEIRPNINNDLVVPMEYVKSKLYKKDTVIIDCRANERYQGLVEPAYSKAGHIPSAKNYFCKDLIKSDFENGSLKDIEFLKKFFKDLNNYDEVILSCGSGISACVNSLALRELDIPHKIYIGSFSDWISYDDNEIKTGQE